MHRKAIGRIRKACRIGIPALFVLIVAIGIAVTLHKPKAARTEQTQSGQAADDSTQIPEDEIKAMDESGEIVLSRVVIPEYVVVHDGAPSDSTANDYYVRYRDYIKNVASSEIYATWPAATIRATAA